MAKKKGSKELKYGKQRGMYVISPRKKTKSKLGKPFLAAADREIVKNKNIENKSSFSESSDYSNNMDSDGEDIPVIRLASKKKKASPNKRKIYMEADVTPEEWAKILLRRDRNAAYRQRRKAEDYVPRALRPKKEKKKRATKGTGRFMYTSDALSNMPPEQAQKILNRRAYAQAYRVRRKAPDYVKRVRGPKKAKLRKGVTNNAILDYYDMVGNKDGYDAMMWGRRMKKREQARRYRAKKKRAENMGEFGGVNKTFFENRAILAARLGTARHAMERNFAQKAAGIIADKRAAALQAL